jgi:hypothetical protein
MISSPGLAFTREDGSQLHPDLITDGFHRLRNHAGLPPIRLHDLRHTAASLALQADVPMKVVSELLGHSSLGITADTYTNVLPEVAAAEAVAGIVPRRQPADAVPGDDAAAFPFRSQEGEQEPETEIESAAPDTNQQVKQGGPRGGRTHNPWIKRRLARCQGMPAGVAGGAIPAGHG